MATEEPLLPETSQSPAIPQAIMESKHDYEAMQKLKKKNLVHDYKSAMYDISRFASEGAENQKMGW